MTALNRSARQHCAPGCRVCAALRRATIEIAAELGLSEVTVERLSEAARLAPTDVMRHSRGSVACCAASAYAETCAQLQHRFHQIFARGETWQDGLGLATAHHLGRLADDPAIARFCYVEAVSGDGQLPALREVFRTRSVLLFNNQYRRRHGDRMIPRVQMEFVSAAIVQTVANHAARGRTDRLPRMLGPLLALTESFEPLGFTAVAAAGQVLELPSELSRHADRADRR